MLSGETGVTERDDNSFGHAGFLLVNHEQAHQPEKS
jgi:hypothetical protein